MPIRFNLQYKAEVKEEQHEKAEMASEVKEGTLKPGFQRPVIIHRAILGSVERMVAVLAEHTGGKWPFWISPRQILVVPVSDKFNEYGMKINNRLLLENINSEIDLTTNTLQKKVRSGQIA